MNNVNIQTNEYEVKKCRLCGEKTTSKNFSPNDYEICTNCYEEMENENE